MEHAATGALDLFERGCQVNVVVEYDDVFVRVIELLRHGILLPWTISTDTGAAGAPSLYDRISSPEPARPASNTTETRG